MNEGWSGRHTSMDEKLKLDKILNEHSFTCNDTHTYVLSLQLKFGEFVDEKRVLDKVLRECFKHVTSCN